MTDSRVTGNFGCQISPDISTRFNVRYVQQYQEQPGALTWKQLQSDPTLKNAALGGVISTRANPGTYMASNKTTVQIDPDSKLETGFQYNNYPINGLGGSS